MVLLPSGCKLMAREDADAGCAQLPGSSSGTVGVQGDRI
jgi:hypothetical protein